MVDTLQSKWAPPVVGAILFLFSYFFLAKEAGKIVLTDLPAPTLEVPAANLEPVEEPPPPVVISPPGPSWTFINSEIDHLVEDLRTGKEDLSARELDLAKEEARIASEKQELQIAIQRFEEMQEDFEKRILRIRTDETENLANMAGVFSAMSAPDALVIMQEMNHEELVKILSFMKPHKVGEILALFSQQGARGARRAAEISELLRRTFPLAGGAATEVAAQAKVSPDNADKIGRLARMYGAMPATNAYQILNQMPDAEIASILALMPEGRASAILSVMGTHGTAGANRATEIGSLMQDTLGDPEVMQAIDDAQYNVSSEDSARFTRMAKMYSAMTQDNALKILGEMDDLEFAKILHFMKGEDAAGILGMLAQQGGANGTTRATILSDLLGKLKSQPAP